MHSIKKTNSMHIKTFAFCGLHFCKKIISCSSEYRIVRWRMMTVLSWLMLCCAAIQNIASVLGSGGSCCAIDLPLLVIHENIEEKTLTCTSYCSSVTYINDASLSFDNFSNAAVIPSSFSTAVVKHGKSSTGMVTIFAFFVPMKQLELAELITSALIGFIEYYNWTQVLIISDAFDHFYLQTGEILYKNLSQSNYSIDYFQVNNEFNEVGILHKIALKKKRIICLSATSQKIKKILSLKKEKNLKWPQYVWIVHSIDRNQLDSVILDGVIELQAKQISTLMSSIPNNNYDQLCRTPFLSLMAESVDIFLWENEKNVHLFNYTMTNGLVPITPPLEVPPDIIIQNLRSVFITLYYLGILVCFVLVTCTLVLYIHFRHEPAIKATSTSLSLLIVVGCYIWIFYLLMLNSTLLPSYPRQTSATRNVICVFRAWLHGIGYPVVLVMSVLIVKLLRIYRIFHCHGKINVHFNGNIALAVYALLLTSPNALICLIWSSKDPYLSELTFTMKNGHLVIAEQCQSQYTIQWSVGLLLHNIILAVVLIIAAVMTRKIKQPDFKDTKKVSAFSFFFFVTMVIGLSYWYILRTINANVILVHAVLQLSHYSLIIQCSDTEDEI